MCRWLIKAVSGPAPGFIFSIQFFISNSLNYCWKSEDYFDNLTQLKISEAK